MGLAGVAGLGGVGAVLVQWLGHKMALPFGVVHLRAEGLVISVAVHP